MARIGAQPGRVPSAELIPSKWSESRRRKINNTGALYSRKACTEQDLSREGKGREGKGREGKGREGLGSSNVSLV